MTVTNEMTPLTAEEVVALYEEFDKAPLGCPYDQANVIPRLCFEWLRLNGYNPRIVANADE